MNPSNPTLEDDAQVAIRKREKMRLYQEELKQQVRECNSLEGIPGTPYCHGDIHSTHTIFFETLIVFRFEPL